MPTPISLRPYAAVSGGALVDAVREQLRAVPYYALGLPRTAQFVPRASLQQLPLSLKMTMQGAQQTERLVDVVYGGELLGSVSGSGRAPLPAQLVLAYVSERPDISRALRTSVQEHLYAGVV